MQYVQTLPVVTAPTAEDTVHATEAVATLHPVEPEITSGATVMLLDPRLPALEQMWVPRTEELEKERRRLCRRIYHDPPLQELRSGLDRRHRNQRRSDLTTAVDEKI